MEKKITILSFTAIILLLSIYLYLDASSNKVSLENLHFSYNLSNSSTHDESYWFSPDYDDSRWNMGGKTFVSYDIPVIYIRQFFEAGKSPPVFYMAGDDNIDAVYVNGNLLCSLDCNKKELPLNYSQPGRNLLAVKLANGGGATTLNIREVKKGSTTLYIVVLISVLLACILYLFEISRNRLILLTFLSASVLIYIISMLGFIDLTSAGLYLLIICSLFILLAGERFLSSPYIIFIFFFVLASAFLMSIFINIDSGGVQDTDLCYSIYYIPYKSLIESHQIPIWNPYMCGGMTLIGDPQSGPFSPSLISIFLFGLTAGVRINFLLHLVIALFGMWLLGKHFGLSGHSRLLPPVVYGFSSIYLHRVMAGHCGYMAYAWIPFAFYYFLEGLGDWRKLFYSSFFLSLTIFDNNNPYYLAFASLLIAFYGGFETIARLYNGFLEVVFHKKQLHIRDLFEKIRPFISVLFVFLVFLLLSSVKLLPIAERNELPLTDRGDRDIGSFKLDDILNVLTNSYVLGVWHESSAYVSLLILSISLTGVLVSSREHAPLFLTSVFFIFIILNVNSPINIWWYLQYLPLFNKLRIVFRVIVIVVLAIGLFSGIALNRLRSHKILSSNVIKLLLIVVLLDLFSTWAFSLNTGGPIFFAETNLDFIREKFNSSDFYQIIYTSVPEHAGMAYSNMYPYIAANKGVINCYTAARPALIYPTPYGSPNYMGEIYIVGGSGTAKIVEFTPNRIDAEVNLTSDSTLVLNQNYYDGWYSNAGLVESYNGLLSVKVNSTAHYVNFYYMPKLFVIGGIITILTIVSILVTILWPLRSDTLNLLLSLRKKK